MLTYLPALHPEELLYSLLARTCRHSGWQSPKLALEEFFGHRSVRAGVFLQTELNCLADRLPARRQLTSKRLAHKTTLLPYLTAFSTPDVRDWALSVLMGENGDADTLYIRLGLVASSVNLTTTLRYCPAYRTEMLEKYGELYWRRDHQLPGVLVCPTHAVPLVDSRVILSHTGQHEFIAADENNCPANPNLPTWSDRANVAARLLEIAKASVALLIAPPNPLPLHSWGREYRTALRARGFGRGNSHIDQSALLHSYYARFGAVIDVLPEAIPDGWLEAITRKHRHAFAPLRHILIRLLIDSRPLVPELRPFGDGPWPCCNPLAEHYGHLMIAECQLHAEKRKIIGVFRCTCGYAFSRAAHPDSRPRILNFGPLFESRLRELVISGTSLRGTAKALHVDTRTVLRYVARLELTTPWKVLPKQVTLPPPDRMTMRERWNRAYCAERSLTRKELRKRMPAVYMWLYRYDREWLGSQPPLPRSLRNNRARINWAHVDAQTAEFLRGEADKLLAHLPPVRVTRAALERALDRRGWLGKRLHKLPLCASILDEVTENEVAFQCRRIAWADAELCRQGLPVQAWRLRRLAGLPEQCAKVVETALFAAQNRGER
ncbi:TnsD family Tn7-like transposition protein [Acidithiobacillus acidisediminis]|uniref:TnsD family Tn7-like transposition protein n=1 Tax=Acidithiobacillus acidisediminis TaxID=2937799 RepID=UPI0020100692|nr:TnsD family Tn7-like transposition protein [Acidithiobacillus sp. S30A2]